MINVPVSIGEFLDKISILKIKNANIKNEEKLANVRKELVTLQDLQKKLDLYTEKERQLEEVNAQLWEYEDQIRRLSTMLHQKQADFIYYAQQIHIVNDRRAEIKKEINIEFNSDLIEEKDYDF